MGSQSDRTDRTGRYPEIPAFSRLIWGKIVQPARATLVDLIFPQRCFVCGGIIGADGALCPSCWGAFDFLGTPACACCGYPFAHEVQEGALCGACTARPPAFAAARAALAYDGPSRDLILAFKHGDHTHYGPAFVSWLARAGVDLLAEADWIVPVPLHRWRLLRRRFNQAALLAHALGRECDLPVVADLLIRRRNTPSQGHRSRTGWARNVSGAFAVRSRRRAALASKTVVLIDDVFTTGATVEACARALTRAGARAVHVLTLARVLRPR